MAVREEAPSVRSVKRALQILSLFNPNKMEWGITEMSRALGVAKSVVHRLVTTFEQEGFLVQNPENGKYRLSIKLFELGSLVITTMDLRRIALPLVEELSRRCGETVHVGILDGTDVISIEEAETVHTLRPAIFIGKRAPLYCTAIGKALLAFLPKAERKRIIGLIRFTRFTPNTITDPESLEKELAAVRMRGYAVDDEEHDIGVRCVGVPILGRQGDAVASVSISGPSVRITREKIPVLAEELKRTALDISRAMGYTGSGREVLTEVEEDMVGQGG
ncbi:MAG: IclR family transcriptional regulator [Bacillota bacterium]